jgi:6-phospho-3-hexuloisomerase
MAAGRTCIKNGSYAMHLGYTVFIVGETNTPAILEGDLLLVASGSGTTSSVVSSAEKAKVKSYSYRYHLDAKSKIAVADNILLINAATKQTLGFQSLGRYRKPL